MPRETILSLRQQIDDLNAKLAAANVEVAKYAQSDKYYQGPTAAAKAELEQVSLFLLMCGIPESVPAPERYDKEAMKKIPLALRLAAVASSRIKLPTIIAEAE